MEIIVKLNDIIDFYKQALIKSTGHEFNAFNDFYYEDDNGKKTASQDPFILGLKVRFKDHNEKNIWLNAKD